ncbi:MAG: Rrf2 family transcriptional regulator [Lachnospiraceae bacterium]|nr:Rrf2 family transcriptional regulator [Lachnospiraceae bacterium]
MMISTKGRYALRVMTQLAQNTDNNLIPLKEIANDQQISLKYLESIMSVLVKHGLVEAASGKGGGYRLSKPADKYTLGEVLRVTEGSLEPVACTGEHCERNSFCNTYPVWKELSDLINGFLDSKTVADLMDQTERGKK